MPDSGPHAEYGLTADTVRDYPPLFIVRRLGAYIRPYMGMAFAALALSLVSSGLLVARPYLVKVAIDSYIEKGVLDGFDRFMMLFLAVYMFRFVSGYFLGMTTGMLGQKVMHDLRMDVFGHVLRMEMSFFDRNRVGRLMTRITDDVNTLNELYTSGAIQIINNATIILGIIGVMLFLDWRLTLISFITFPFLAAGAYMFADRVRIIYRRIRRETARLNAFLQETIGGIRIIQLMRRTVWSYARFSKYSDDLMDVKVRNVLYYGMFFPVMEFIGVAGVVLIIAAGGWRVNAQALDIGVLVAFIRLIDMLFWPIRELAENFNVMLSAMASSERIFTLLDTPPRIREPQSPVSVGGDADIVFDHVWFRYDGSEEWILRDVSFRVSPGERVAVVGPSGAGKTSIINLLLRFYDVQKGRILLGGTDVRDISLDDLRGRIAHVGQEPFLFNRSIAANIALGDDGIPEDIMRDVLVKMGADAMLANMGEGLGTIVREGGSRLSQGQRQLVSFARALTADRDILVLDEATANVDTYTESLLQKAVPILMENRTSIVIAHRLSTIRSVDRIHVLARGRIRETGDHASLMAEDGLYARLVRMHLTS